ncbi:MAG: hypothetical protein PHZ04_04255 [Patescibacteria group bacterium]|nr:hypothetical protein [Patescibacteria group bacterium]MDD5554474.1 hypothetical protein [Patescibacteria group bacterium]
MKNIFKKSLKFISSRLFYLIIGIFLAVGATYVYATWDSAKTGGTGQLSESNWNELATMLQSEFSALNTKIDAKGQCFNTFGGCYCDTYPSNNCPCTCTPPACPSGYTSVGESPKFWLSEAFASNSYVKEIYQCVRYCCK